MLCCAAGVVAYIRGRAIAEERYGKALKEAAEASGSGGMLGAFALGPKGDVTRDSNTLYAALEASRAGAHKVCVMWLVSLVSRDLCDVTCVM